MGSDWDRRYEEHPVRTTIAGISWGWLIVLVVIVLALLTSAALWAAGVFTSDVKGRGDAIKQKNSALNRIGAQERFEDIYASIKAQDLKLDGLAEDAKNGGATEKTNYRGAVNYCLDLVGQYNANARKYTQQDFRSADLPYQIDTLDPTTDCKESAST